MTKNGNSLSINSRKAFLKNLKIEPAYFEKAFEFAYAMTFGKDGEHRNHRSGGRHLRRNSEIFCDTLQGKLSEYAIFQSLGKKYGLEEPDVRCYELGKWDQFDFSIHNKNISVKSTKNFGNLLLLETKDWNQEGQYIPNQNGDVDFTFLVRLEDVITSTFKQQDIYYSDFIEKEELWKLLKNLTVYYDIPGYITKNDLIDLIQNNFIIKQGELLNGKMAMDADNYYCQVGDMRDINTFMIPNDENNKI